MSLAQYIGSLIDNAVMVVSPVRGARRMAARRVVALQQRNDKLTGPNLANYESASDDRLHSSSRWIGSRLSPDSMLEEDLEIMRQRSRELCDSDSIGGIIESDLDHVVGSGFTIQSTPVEGQGITEARADAISDELEAVFREWSKNCDLTRRKSFWIVCRIAWRHFRADGEALAVLSDVGGADKILPLTVELIDPVRLDTPPQHLANPLVRMGIEYDTRGVVVAYWIRNKHPYDSKQHSDEYKRVPAERVIHLYDPFRVGQSRGIPWFNRVMNRIKDAKDLDEAGIIAAQIEACMTAFVKISPESGQNPFDAAKRNASRMDNGKRIEDMAPGQINYLNPEEDVVFNNPNRQNSVGPLQELNHRRIAAGLNYPYEVLMKDWDGTSFAGGRLVLSGLKMSVRSSQRLMSDLMIRAVWNRFVEECVILGGTSLTAQEYMKHPWRWQAHKVMPTSWVYAVNPGEEVKANSSSMQTNQSTLEDVLGEKGMYWKETLRQRSKERAMERELDVIPPETALAEHQAELSSGAAATDPEDSSRGTPKESAVAT